jgi:hypothetical protein
VGVAQGVWYEYRNWLQESATGQLFCEKCGSNDCMVLWQSRSLVAFGQKLIFGVPGRPPASGWYATFGFALPNSVVKNSGH